MSSGTEHGEDRFRRVYAEAFESLLAYALRRVAHPEDAADVVAETFLVAWRRRQDNSGRRGGSAVVVRGGPAGGEGAHRRAAAARVRRRGAQGHRRE
ncbi:hypothetical protein PSH25_002645 [Micromonospora sp. PSH25]|nr:hypothetical protein [Micromonospora foliorum]